MDRNHLFSHSFQHERNHPPGSKWKHLLFLIVFHLLTFSVVACSSTSGSTEAAQTPIATNEPSQTAPPEKTGVAVTDLDVATRCYVEAVNAQHLDNLVDCFAPEGIVIDVTRRFEGRDAIRTWANNEVIGGNLQVLDEQPHPGGDGTRLLVRWAFSPASSGFEAYYDFTTRDELIYQLDLQYA